MKLTVILFSLCISFSAIAADSAPTSVQQFFANYGLLASGWQAFVDGQSRVLSEDLVTIVRDHRGSTVYRGKMGYFASIQDWSKSFKTDRDFKTEFLGPRNGLYAVALHGTILFNKGGQEIRIPSSDHCWEELFAFDNQNRISRLEVNMNFGCKR